MTKVVMITGASSGIGEACARLFAKNGYHLILNARRIHKLETLKNELFNNYNTQIQVLPFDVRNVNEVSNAISTIKEDFFPDILINNAGLALGLSSFYEGNIEHWNTMIDTNIKGLLYTSRTVVPKMIERGNGHIINIGSIAGKEVYDKGNVYCGTKHAVDALTRSFRLELASKGIRVTGVHPGAVETEFSIVRFEGDIERAKKVYLGFEKLIAEDIADAVFWCATRKPHVNINDVVIMPQAQPMAGLIHRKNIPQ